MCILNFGVKFCILLIFCVVVILDENIFNECLCMVLLEKNWEFFFIKICCILWRGVLKVFDLYLILLVM